MKTEEWIVETELNIRDDEKATDRIMDDLEMYGVTVSDTKRGWTLVSLSVDTDTPAKAVSLATALIGSVIRSEVLSITAIPATAWYEREGDDDTQLMSVSEASKALNRSKARVYQLIGDGRLPTIAMGKRGTMIPRAAVLSLANSLNPSDPVLTKVRDFRKMLTGSK